MKTVKVEELIGNLTTYEMEVKFRDGRDSGDSRKKSIALKGTVDSDDEESEATAELALLMKRFKKWTQKHGNPVVNQRVKTRLNKFPDDSEKEKIIYYQCNKPGHIKPNCPLIQSSKEKKKPKQN